MSSNLKCLKSSAYNIVLLIVGGNKITSIRITFPITFLANNSLDAEYVKDCSKGLNVHLHKKKIEKKYVTMGWVGLWSNFPIQHVNPPSYTHGLKPLGRFIVTNVNRKP